MIDPLVWLALGAVTLVAGSRSMERVSRRFPITRLLGGGWMLLALGVIVGPHALGVLSGERLHQVQPILVILLTWTGVIVGLQCRRALVRAIPSALWRWMGMDFAVCLLLSVVAAGIVARIWRPESDAAQVLLTGTIAAMAIGWNPETRGLGIRSDAPAKRLAILVQGGAGGLAIVAVMIASLALQCAYETPQGGVVFAPLGGLLTLAMEIGAVAVVSLGAHEILRDTREDDARTSLIVIGALCLLSGIAVTFGGSGLLAGMIFGATLGMSSRRMRGLEGIISSAEPVVASGCFFFAGMTLELPLALDSATTALTIGAIALMLATTRRVLKPLIMKIALAPVAASIALDSPIARAPIRQAPLTIVILLAFAIQDSSGIADQLLAVAVLISLFSIALTGFLSGQGSPAT
ncbi:MAG: hypothetical protein EXS01_05415 [Phycisphaerales bacterium]|nr:hypothetical protein [Phycisphaerales bacterium]